MTTERDSIVVMGVSGSGKTTVGRRLSEVLRRPFVEGDSLHPPANVEKMRHGVPLDDADRAPWLSAIHDRLRDAGANGAPIVVACSALKQTYRDRLASDVPLIWVYLKGTPALIRSRLEHRPGHFMNPTLLDSQFGTLEEPTDAIVEDVRRTPDAIVLSVLQALAASAREGAAAGTHRRTS